MKLFPHAHVPELWLRSLVADNAMPYVKQLFTSDLVDHFPSAYTIARLSVPGDDATEAACYREGKDGVAAYVNLADNAFTSGRYEGLRHKVWAFEGPNEPNVGDAPAQDAYSAFIYEWANWMNGKDRRVLIGSFSRGTPDVTDANAIRRLAPVWEVASRPGNGLALHQYGWPMMQTESEWHSLRHRKLWDQLEHLHLPLPASLYITECGIDGTGYTTGGRGWKTACNGDIHRCADQLAWYDGELQKDTIIKAGFLFTSACPSNYGWSDFELDESAWKVLLEKKPLKFVRPVKGTVTGRFGDTTPPYPATGHQGLDLSCYLEPVLAAHSGILHCERSPLMGRFCTITGGGIRTVYGHLNSFTAYDGSHVDAGTQIAVSGNSGTACFGYHLHVEVWLGGRRVDPEPYFQ